MKYILGIDFGGGASKATLLDENGYIVETNTVEYNTYHPFAGACEQNPDEWYHAMCDNIQQVITKSKISASDIACAAVDSATHTAVLCNQDMLPIRQAIHWTDARSIEEVNYLKRTALELIQKETYQTPDTIWTLPQLMWIRAHETENFNRIRYILFEKDYLRYCLTGVVCTDYIEAEGSMLFNLNSMNWSKELCDLAGIDVSMLPQIKNPEDIIGEILPAAAHDTGLKAGTPVICGTTDTVMEIFASGAIKERQMTVKLATAGRICVITKEAFPQDQLINYSHVIKGLWYPGTATKSCAASYRWYRDTFGGDYQELNEAAQLIKPGCDGLMFHPYLNGELTPYADPLLCGSFTGIRAIHEKGHFTRAVMEGVSLSLLDCMHTMDKIGIKHDSSAILIGGGAKSKLWRQITADVLNIELKTTECSDSSLGTAMLAGIATGIFRSYQDAAEKCVKVTQVTVPNQNNIQTYQHLFLKYKDIHDALVGIYHKYKEF